MAVTSERLSVVWVGGECAAKREKEAGKAPPTATLWDHSGMDTMTDVVTGFTCPRTSPPGLLRIQDPEGEISRPWGHPLLRWAISPSEALREPVLNGWVGIVTSYGKTRTKFSANPIRYGLMATLAT